ncbi:GNAT family N-acetyltransferase [Cellulomonas composti]|uniref:GNAT family N-acetyltransferase n=1 Tax=Cellulomonas composti TaxID=266130 RepID=A0A511J7Z4_9CELL|nr:GNAT family N-acetyltransferase [Cellulomonas composti]GEL94108.1 GNAT family N-acetyltransferase [Cellulomonas composti]
MTIVRQVPVTATATEPAAALLRGYVTAMNAVTRDTWVVDDFRREPDEVLGAMRPTPYELRPRFVALADDADDEPRPDQVLGWGVLNLPQRENTSWAYLQVGVLPAARGRGIGTALYDALFAIALEDDRTVFWTETEHASEAPAGPDALVAPTGSGRVPADDAGVRFARSRGWRLEQVERHSRLELPVDADRLARQRADAAAVAGAGYRTISWTGPTPALWQDAMALLRTRMSAGVPLAGLVYEEDQWDAARVRDHDDQLVARGMQIMVTAALHEESGELVAYSEFEIPSVTWDFVYQGDTFVLPPHRGHRLGMLVKAVNLQRLAADLPDVRRVSTWNAEENDHMLAINVALGFRPAGCCGSWQLKVAEPAP